jgi:glutamine synthetase
MEGSAGMDNEKVVETAQQAGLSLIRFLYCDTNSIIRGKNVPIDRLRQRMADGVGISRALLAVNSLDELAPVPELTPVGEVRLQPDPGTFTILPYADLAGALICDLVQPDGAPLSVCGRSFLKRVCRQAALQGLHVKAAFEMEFTLATKTDGTYRPFDQTLCYSSIALQAAHPFYLDLVRALEQQEMTVELCHPELSPGQHEISIRHTDPVRAADNQVRLRETVRAVAASHGLYASFAPKPFAEYIGNGMHIHLSLWNKDGRNIFYDPAAEAQAGSGGFSEQGLSFLAGVLSHLPALTSLTCATVNSYRRLAPHSLSGAFAAYGYDNREAALRIPSTFRSDPQSFTNLELKAADATGNPYLALGALLVAGLDGLNRSLDPGLPVSQDPDTLSEDQLATMGIERLPKTLEEALDALEADPVLTAALGELLARSYVAIKRSEIAAYAPADEASQRDVSQSDVAEFAGHFYKY